MSGYCRSEMTLDQGFLCRGIEAIVFGPPPRGTVETLMYPVRGTRRPLREIQHRPTFVAGHISRQGHSPERTMSPSASGGAEDAAEMTPRHSAPLVYGRKSLNMLRDGVWCAVSWTRRSWPLGSMPPRGARHAPGRRAVWMTWGS